MKSKREKREPNCDHREILALTCIENLGSRRILRLLQEFDSPRELFAGDVGRISRIEGISRKLAYAVVTFREWDRVDHILRETNRAGAGLIGVNDPDYPPLLRQIYDPPPLLWVRGERSLLSAPALSIVGTRRPDRYGEEQAAFWAGEISGAGLAVVSGLAYGVDAIAHRSASGRRGKTVAILASGIDRVSPAGNRKLAERILSDGGAIATEFLPGSRPYASSFPVRNRVISGLGHGLLVIQSGCKGGSMITARSALDQSREVFVIPHSLNTVVGKGNHELIRSGQGKLVECLEDIFCELPMAPDGDVASQGAGRKNREAWSELTGEPLHICRLLSREEMHIDRLTEATGKPLRELLPLLLELELEGMIRQRAGGYVELRNS